jgi:deoxyribodipyrimidine photo-lyase
VRPPSLEALGIERNDQLLRGGERSAHLRLRRFCSEGARGYEQARDRMGEAGTSRLSADLKFGTLSPRMVWHAILASKAPKSDKDKFTSELLWREFTHHTLHDRPSVLEEPFRDDFAGFPWRHDPQGLAAWKDGRTGYPIVDAAARQLLAEGYVHNRARMVSASFLTKHLAVSYQEGEAHYLKWLTDGDWAPNNAGWQWTAGCGCDAQPYFRVFNPVTQGQKFDADGAYVRRWVPEIARLPDEHIHAPWAAPAEALAGAGVRLGETYPRPIVDHSEARARFLALAKSHLGR